MLLLLTQSKLNRLNQSVSLKQNSQSHPQVLSHSSQIKIHKRWIAQNVVQKYLKGITTDPIRVSTSEGLEAVEIKGVSL